MAGGRKVRTLGSGWSQTATYTAIGSTALTAVTPAPTTGQYLVIDDLLISSDAAISVTLTRETYSTASVKLYFAANTTQHYIPAGLFKLGAANKKLNAKTSGAGNITVTAITHSEA